LNSAETTVLLGPSPHPWTTTCISGRGEGIIRKGGKKMTKEKKTSPEIRGRKFFVNCLAPENIETWGQALLRS